MSNNMLYTPAGVLDAKENANVVVEGLIENIREEVASNNTKYITGLITNKSEAVKFKSWDTELCNIEPLIGKVCQVSGKVNIYNKEFSIITNGKGVDISIVDTGKLIDDYIYISPVSPEKIIASLKKKIASFKNETCKKIGLEILKTYGELFTYYPFSPNCHREKGGFIYHIYLCICKACNPAGIPVINGEPFTYNEEIVQIAILASRLGVFDFYIVDKNTGKITEERNDIILLTGSYNHYEKFLSIVNNLDNLDENIVRQLTHCIKAIHSSSKKPVTTEALIASEVINFELDIFAYGELLTSMETGDVSKTNGGKGNIVVQV